MLHDISRNELKLVRDAKNNRKDFFLLVCLGPKEEDDQGSGKPVAWRTEVVTDVGEKAELLNSSLVFSHMGKLWPNLNCCMNEEQGASWFPR